MTMRTIHILCLGDSLTAGFTHAGSDYHPYTTALQARLKELWPFTEIKIDLDGVPGDMVTPPGKKTKVPYDWIIVLGGTNDLGQSKIPEEIISSLQTVYKTAIDHSTSAHVLALTIPESANSPGITTQRRDVVNESIAKLQWSRFHVFDLHAFFPWESMSKERRTEIWDDGIHFTPWGYDILGNALGTSLSAHIDTEFQDSWEGGSAETASEKLLYSKLKKSTGSCCVIQ